MVKIVPMKIPGRWHEGYALDFHTVRSEFVGYDHLGREQFETERSEMGELLYKLKYRGYRNTIIPIATTAAAFIQAQKWPLDCIIPTPPSNQRVFQPVLEIAKELGQRLSFPMYADSVVKTKTTAQLKNVFDYHQRLRLLADAYEMGENLAKQSILLFDDLYRSGATLNAVTELLYSKGQAARVYALTLTRTRSKQ